MPDTPSTHSIADDFVTVRRALRASSYKTGSGQDHEWLAAPDALRRIEEQFDAMQQAARKFLATGNEIDLADLTTPGEYLVDLIPHQWPGYASTPATGYRDEDSGVWIDKPGPHARRPSNPATSSERSVERRPPAHSGSAPESSPAKSLCDMTHPGEPCPASSRQDSPSTTEGGE